jgi:hypothetical protein
MYLRNAANSICDKLYIGPIEVVLHLVIQLHIHTDSAPIIYQHFFSQIHP